MCDLLARFDASRNLDGTPGGIRDYGNGVTGSVSITFGSGKLDHTWGVFGTRYSYRYTAKYQWKDKNGILRIVKLSSDYYSEETAWRDVDKYASQKQLELAFS